MRRTLLLLAGLALLSLPAAAARASSDHAAAGYLVVQNALTDGSGAGGRPVATVAVNGYVLGHIKQEGKVQIYRLASTPGSLAAQVAGVDVQRRAVEWRGSSGTEFSGSDFRFRAVGGVWRVVVYGAGISLYAGGTGNAFLHGSVFNPQTDGQYSFNGAPFASLPSGVVKGKLRAK